MNAKAASPLTILLVEDHEDTRNALAFWFERSGHTILAAHSQKAGLALARKRAFDLLFCDLHLPDGDGAQLMSHLGAEKPFVGIAIGGSGGPDEMARTKAAGFFTHLLKPFTADELDRALADAQRELARRSQ